MKTQLSVGEYFSRAFLSYVWENKSLIATLGIQSRHDICDSLKNMANLVWLLEENGKGRGLIFVLGTKLEHKFYHKCIIY